MPHSSIFGHFKLIDADGIKKAREDVISSILDKCRKLVNWYIDTDRCSAFKGTEKSSSDSIQHRQDRRDCNAMVLGSLLQGLKVASFWPIPNASNVSSPIGSIEARLMIMRCGIKLDRGSTKSSHKACGFKLRLHLALIKIIEYAPCGILDCHIKHMEEHKKKLE